MHKYDVSMTADVSLVAPGPTTVWQLITPATRWAQIKEINGGFRSVTSTDQPIIIELVSQSTAGTSSSTLTPQPRNSAMPAALCTVNTTFSAEPTLVAVRFTHILPPQGGNIIFQIPLGDEIIVCSSPNAITRLGLRVTNAQNQLFRGGFFYEE